MTFQQLRYISAIAKYGSFNEAARHLFVSQSSISTAVKELEQELGISIFIRTSRGTELSPQGQEFMRYNNRLLGVLAEISERYQPSEESSRLLFTVSSQHYLFVEDAFVELVARSGDSPYQLNFREGTLAQVLEDVSGFRSEIGVIFMSKYNIRSLEKTLRDRKLEFHSFITVQPSVFIRRGHPLAARKDVTYADLAPFPYVHYETDATVEASGLNDIMPDRRRRQSIRVFERSALLEVISRTDAYNIGSGLLPEKYISRFTHVPIRDDEEAFMNIGWISRRNEPLSETADHFVGLIRHFVDGYNKLHSRQI